MMGKKIATQTWTSSQRLEASEAEVPQCKKHFDSIKHCPLNDDATHNEFPLQPAFKILPKCNLRPWAMFPGKQG